jgi:hypothetical protein
MIKKPIKAHSGRPPKFQEPRQPVTMILPTRVLDALSRVDTDRARAVVKVTEAVMGTDKRHSEPVELVEMAANKFIIVVGASETLKRIPSLKLIEIAPGRHLLTISSGTPVEALEVALSDMIHEPKHQGNEPETRIMRELLNLIGAHRRTRRLTKSEILIISGE